jgi:WD40 repeat protein
VNVHSRSTSTPRHLPLPATVAVGASDNGGRIVALYGDASLFVWNSKRILQPPDSFSLSFSKYRSFLHHSGIISSVASCPSVLGCELGGGFVSCGSDGSVRFWNLSSNSNNPMSGGDGTSRPQTSLTSPPESSVSAARPQTAPSEGTFPKNLLSKDMACATFLNWKHDEGSVESCAVEKIVIDLPVTSEVYLSNQWKDTSAIVCMTVSHSGQHVAVADSTGSIHIVNSVSHVCEHVVPVVNDLVGDALFDGRKRR